MLKTLDDVHYFVVNSVRSDMFVKYHCFIGIIVSFSWILRIFVGQNGWNGDITLQQRHCKKLSYIHITR